LAHLVVLLPDPRVRARFADALSGVHSVTLAPTWTELRRAAAREDVHGCAVDADSPSREQAFLEIRDLRRRLPDVALVVYADVRESDPELVHLGRLGVDGVVLARRPPWASAIRRAIEDGLAAAGARAVGRSLRGRYPDPGVDAVVWAVEHAAEGPSVARLAAALGHTPRSLAALLRASGLPTPTRVLLWGRLLQAGALLARDACTVEETALRLGYATASSFGRAMKSETGCTPGEVAQRGGMACVRARLFRSRARRSTGAVRPRTATPPTGLHP